MCYYPSSCTCSEDGLKHPRPALLPTCIPAIGRAEHSLAMRGSATLGNVPRHFGPVEAGIPELLCHERSAPTKASLPKVQNVGSRQAFCFPALTQHGTPLGGYTLRAYPRRCPCNLTSRGILRQHCYRRNKLEPTSSNRARRTATGLE